MSAVSAWTQKLSSRDRPLYRPTFQVPPYPTMLHRCSSCAVIGVGGHYGELYLRSPSLSHRCALIRYGGRVPYRCGSPVGGGQRALSCSLALFASPPSCQAIALCAAVATMGISIEAGAVSSQKDILCNTAPERCFLLDGLRIVPRWLVRTTSLPWLRKRQVAVSHMRPEGVRNTTPLNGGTSIETQDVPKHRVRYLRRYHYP